MTYFHIEKSIKKKHISLLHAPLVALNNNFLTLLFIIVIIPFTFIYIFFGCFGTEKN
jgi:hypothetical protein